MGIKQCVGPICLGDLGVGHGIGQPSVVRLTGERDYPARHHHGIPVNCELLHERMEDLPGRLACDRYAAVRRKTSTSCSNNHSIATHQPSAEHCR